uniref:2'-phosphotransferase n=1 Tax=Noctiluca scintillans TaxID=2966 RepID=A0A7S0ZRR3_NOCSC
MKPVTHANDGYSNRENGGLPEHLNALSRSLARVLRHSAAQLGLQPREGTRWYRFEEVVATGGMTHWSELDFERVVKDSRNRGQPRFETEQVDGQLWIRATQKHSIDVPVVTHEAAVTHHQPSRATSHEAAPKPEGTPTSIRRDGQDSSYLWKKFIAEGHGSWWWREADGDWFLEASSGLWARYSDPVSGKFYWWKDDEKWFWEHLGCPTPQAEIPLAASPTEDFETCGETESTWI